MTKSPRLPRRFLLAAVALVATACPPADPCAAVVCPRPETPPRCLDATTIEEPRTGVCDPATRACVPRVGTRKCAAGNVCMNGACVCDAATCMGCCTATGCVATAALSPAQCGAGGAACTSCDAGSTCGSAGQCQACAAPGVVQGNQCVDDDVSLRLSSSPGAVVWPDPADAGVSYVTVWVPQHGPSVSVQVNAVTASTVLDDAGVASLSRAVELEGVRGSFVLFAKAPSGRQRALTVEVVRVRSVTTEGSGYCFLPGDGGLRCDGTARPPVAAPWVSVDGPCGLSADGKAYCYDSDGGAWTPHFAQQDVVQLSRGCVLTRDDQLLCARAGSPASIDPESRVEPDAPPVWVQVECRGGACCGLPTADGVVLCWGSHAHGLFGAAGSSALPVRLSVFGEDSFSWLSTGTRSFFGRQSQAWSSATSANAVGAFGGETVHLESQSLCVVGLRDDGTIWASLDGGAATALPGALLDLDGPEAETGTDELIGLTPGRQVLRFDCAGGSTVLE